MTLVEINQKFTDIIPMLEGIVKGISYKAKKKLDTHAVINEAYLYIYDRQDLCTTPDMLQRICINYIKQNIYWSTSKLNKQESVNNLGDLQWHDEAEDDSDIDDKIELEKWYASRKGTLDLYRAWETDRIKCIIFDLFYTKGIQKGVDLAKHLGINKDYACRYIRELKQDIKNFESNEIKN